MILTVHLIIVTWSTAVSVKSQQVSIADVGFGKANGAGLWAALNAAAVPSAYSGIHRIVFTAVSYDAC